MEWLALIIIAGLIWHFVTRHAVTAAATNSPASPRPRTVPVEGFVWPELGDYEFDIVGERFAQDVLKALAGEHGRDSAAVYTTAQIVPYSHNPHDDKAVRVEIAGCTVGHLSRKDARSFRRRLNGKKLGVTTTTCGALIMGGFTSKSGEKASYGVRLDINPFEN